MARACTAPSSRWFSHLGLEVEHLLLAWRRRFRTGYFLSAPSELVVAVRHSRPVRLCDNDGLHGIMPDWESLGPALVVTTSPCRAWPGWLEVERAFPLCQCSDPVLTMHCHSIYSALRSLLGPSCAHRRWLSLGPSGLAAIWSERFCDNAGHHGIMPDWEFSGWQFHVGWRAQSSSICAITPAIISLGAVGFCVLWRPCTAASLWPQVFGPPSLAAHFGAHVLRGHAH